MATAIAAASGKGKSAFMQEYIVAMLGAGGRVWVIDIGCTYENACHMLGGTFIRFHSEAKLSLNPFTFIHDFNASLSMLKPLLSSINPSKNNSSNLLEDCRVSYDSSISYFHCLPLQYYKS